MVDLAIPITGGLAIVLMRCTKRWLERNRNILNEVHDNALSDMSAGAGILIGINTMLIAIAKTELFHLESADINFLLALAGLFFIVEGLKHIRKSILPAAYANR